MPEFLFQLIRNKIGYKEDFDINNFSSLIEAITYQIPLNKTEDNNESTSFAIKKLI